MKIALVHELLLKLGGAERVLRQLLDIYPQSPVYTLLHNPKKTEDWFHGERIYTTNLQKYYKILNSPKYLLPKMIKAIESFDFKNFDLVISSSSAFAHGINTKEVKHICYCHSPMRYAWDYTHEYTKNMSFIMRYISSSLLKDIRLWDYKIANRPHKIIANSKHVQKRISKYWRQESQVIYPPVNIKSFIPSPSHEDYFLIVSALTPFKRIDLAIQAFNKIGRKLIIIGDGSQRKLLESMSESNIEFLGRKSDKVVREYMQNCRAFIFPGEEDFGITPIEAMASGKPVLAYAVGGVLESVEAGISGEFFKEATVESFLDGLMRLMLNEKKYSYKQIRKNVERFECSIFEEKIQKIIKTI